MARDLRRTRRAASAISLIGAGPIKITAGQATLSKCLGKYEPAKSQYRNNLCRTVHGNTYVIERFGPSKSDNYLSSGR